MFKLNIWKVIYLGVGTGAALALPILSGMPIMLLVSALMIATLISGLLFVELIRSYLPGGNLIDLPDDDSTKPPIKNKWEHLIPRWWH